MPPATRVRFGILVSLLSALFTSGALSGFAQSRAARKSTRRTLYVNQLPLIGGPLRHWLFTANGQRTNQGVSGVEKAEPFLAAAPPEGARLLKIEADVHLETQRRSPTTPTPQYRNYEVLVIDKVYRAELVEPPAALR